MICACRTKSLRIFIQSFTDLRVADPAIPRPIQLYRLTSPSAFRPAPVHYPSRLFSSASRICAPVQERREDATSSLADRVEEEPSQAFFNTAGDTINNELPTPTLLASSDDLNAAKKNGAIFELSSESLDTLLASLNPTSKAGQVPTQHKRNKTGSSEKAGSSAQSESQRLPESPVTSSQLKRRRILKKDARPKWDTETKPEWKEPWLRQKEALQKKFPEGWKPRKRLSPDALEGIRALNKQFPEQYTTPVLAKQFAMSPEAIRRILRTRWAPRSKEAEHREERWFNRGKAIWSKMAALGTKPPRKWRREGIVREPRWNRRRGPRTEYPYVPRHMDQSAQKKVSSNLV
ncbi:hypothetical protein F4859DRAFT_483945 [Xylaria cf. heliscus]|nr:hypothetical protein F4859DRAFT_483945 [Xylaria cf. heliscus]